MLIASLTTSFLDNIANNPDVPASVVENADVQLANGVPFVSDAQLSDALDQAGVDDTTAQAIIDSNAEARVEALRISLALLAMLGILAVFSTGKIPDRPTGAPAVT